MSNMGKRGEGAPGHAGGSVLAEARGGGAVRAAAALVRPVAALRVARAAQRAADALAAAAPAAPHGFTLHTH
jgi:hypothetical protein